MNFCSDNTTAASPEIIAHLMEVNSGHAMPYGADEVTGRLQARLGQIFETDLAMFPVATGTAANVLALSVFCPTHGAVLCHRESHIQNDECGAPELATGGAKLVPLEGKDVKLTPAILQEFIDGGWAGVVHHVQPTVVSITNATEAGTVYTPAEVAAIAEVCRAAGLKLHMDGARFANALVHLGCSPADLTWKAGVDALSFGATKNGAMGAEAALFFNSADADVAGYKRKRGGHLFSKMRFLSAQIEAYLADDLWLRNATHANAMAGELVSGLTKLDGVRLRHPVEANEIFIHMPQAMSDRLLEAGFAFYPWVLGGPDCHRLVTAWNTDPADVRAFIETASAI